MVFSLAMGDNIMASKSMAPIRWLLALGLVLPVTGCLAAGAAAAGAGAGIYLTSRGAESLVESSVDQVAARARAVMSEEGIVPDEASMEKSGDKREFKGKKGDLDVTIEIEKKDSKTTRVEVAARKNLAEWDKDYAQQVLSKIVEKG
jgi:peroxiredoxin family protein